MTFDCHSGAGRVHEHTSCRITFRHLSATDADHLQHACTWDSKKNSRFTRCMLQIKAQTSKLKWNALKRLRRIHN
jgi:hypothetical protein